MRSNSHYEPPNSIKQIGSSTTLECSHNCSGVRYKIEFYLKLYVLHNKHEVTRKYNRPVLYIRHIFQMNKNLKCRTN